MAVCVAIEVAVCVAVCDQFVTSYSVWRQVTHLLLFGQDPEGILAPPIGGHIARRSLAKQVVEDKELAKQVEAERERARAELQKLRDVSAAGCSRNRGLTYFVKWVTSLKCYTCKGVRLLLESVFGSFALRVLLDSETAARAAFL